MTQKTFGLALIVLGVVLLIISLAADLLGLGAKSGIGWKQLTGAAVGILVFLMGAWLRRRKAHLPG
jgi:hypothetical protein